MDEVPPTERPVAPTEAPVKPGVPHTNGLAMISLVLGIVALIGPAIALMNPLLLLVVPAPLTALTAIPAVIFGHVALRTIQSSGNNATGSGLAIAGLVTGYVSIVLMGLAIVYFQFILPAQQRELEQTFVQQQRKMEKELKRTVLDPIESLLPTPKRVQSPPRMRFKTSNPGKSEAVPRKNLAASMEKTIQANEAAVIQDLNTIIKAQTAYHSENGRYAGSLQSLNSASQGLLSGNWSGVRNGYSFSLMASGDLFRVSATPEVPGHTGRRSFFTDVSGVIRYSPEGNADKNSPPLDE